MKPPRSLAALAPVALVFLSSPALANSSGQDAAAPYGISQNTNAGTLLSDPRAQEALQKYAPQVASDPQQMQMVRSMNMGQLEALARDMLPSDMLAKIEAKLAGMGR